MHRHLLVLALITLAGLVLRGWLLARANFKLDYDEAMIGLLARDIAAGRWFGAFVPAQPTLGAAEAWVLAPLLQLFGTSRVAFRIYALLTAAGYILSSYWLGWACFNTHRAALVAALAAAFAPAYILVTGAKTWGFTIETLILGNILIVLTHAASQRRNTRAVLIAGLCAGVMFWNTWLSMYYLIPVGIVWLVRGNLRRQIPLVLIAFLVGSLPFWLHNFQANFDSFATLIAANTAPQAETITLARRLLIFVTEQFPHQTTGYPSWTPDQLVIRWTATGLYSVGLLLLVRQAVRQRSTALLLTASLLVTIPMIYALSSYSNDARLSSIYGVDATGRYITMLHSALPIAIAAFATISRRSIGFGLVLGVVALNIFTGVQINATRAFDSPYYNRQPDNLQPLIRVLNDAGITRVWTDAGIGRPLMFDTDRAILASDYYDRVNGGVARFPREDEVVDASSHTAYVVPIIPGQTDTPLRRALDAAEFAYTMHHLDSLAIYIPDERVQPESIEAGLGPQY